MNSNNKDKLKRSITTGFRDGLKKTLGGSYEPRETQEEMAMAVSDAISTGSITVIEAGTGLGKSMAYLIPVLIHCSLNNTRTVVSTFTKSLQNQLISKDFPLAEKATGSTSKGSLLMGRSNYACKLAVMLKLSSSSPPEAGVRGTLQRIMNDQKGELQSIKGIDNLGGGILGQIVAPSSETLCRGCEIRDSCFLTNARKKALMSDVVFVNHALLFSHISSGGNLLGEFDLLVIDEAHHLEDVATDALSLSISPDAIRGGGGSLITSSIEEQIRYGLLRLNNELPSASKELQLFEKELNIGIRKADVAMRELFKSILETCKDALGDSLSGGALPARSIPYSSNSPLFYASEGQLSKLKDSLQEIKGKSERALAFLVNECGMPNGLAGILESLVGATQEMWDKLSFLVSAEDEDFVFFFRVGQDSRVTEFCAAPLDISAQLGSILDETSNSTVLTSATLAVDGDFSYTLRKTGLLDSKRVRVLAFESPFELNVQQKILVASFLPEPREDDYYREVSNTLCELSTATSRKMLVLCTSRTQVDCLSSLLDERPETSGLVLAHTSSSSRISLMEEFRKSRRKILIGLASFWEGIDLPGDLLELVAILKMPFLVPGDPIVSARVGKLQREGSNPFGEYFLPDAILRLKQGIGRLIRSSSDRGVVVLLDSRLDTKGYGPAVLKSVPGKWRVCHCLGELLAETTDMIDP